MVAPAHPPSVEKMIVRLGSSVVAIPLPPSTSLILFMRKTRERRRRVHGVVDAVLAFLHLDLGHPADPDYRYAARQLGQPLLEFFAVTQLTLSHHPLLGALSQNGYRGQGSGHAVRIPNRQRQPSNIVI